MSSWQKIRISVTSSANLRYSSTSFPLNSIYLALTLMKNGLNLFITHNLDFCSSVMATSLQCLVSLHDKLCSRHTSIWPPSDIVRNLTFEVCRDVQIHRQKIWPLKQRAMWRSRDDREMPLRRNQRCDRRAVVDLVTHQNQKMPEGGGGEKRREKSTHRHRQRWWAKDGPERGPSGMEAMWIIRNSLQTHFGLFGPGWTRLSTYYLWWWPVNTCHFDIFGKYDVHKPPCQRLRESVLRIAVCTFPRNFWQAWSCQYRFHRIPPKNSSHSSVASTMSQPGASSRVNHLTVEDWKWWRILSSSKDLPVKWSMFPCVPILITSVRSHQILRRWWLDITFCVRKSYRVYEIDKGYM